MTQAEQMEYALSGVLLLLLGMILVESLAVLVLKKSVTFIEEYYQPYKNIGFSVACSIALQALSLTVSVVALAVAGHAVAPWHLGDAWYNWIAALLIFEFWYWLQHWLAHNVRLLWCIHSAHHAMDRMNLSVGGIHNPLEALFYFPLFFGFLPAFCGVPLHMLLVVSLVDKVWGTWIHVSPHLLPNRMGVLEKFMQTPAYHRVHHARNLDYMDTNYCSITLFWDWVFGTLQRQKSGEMVDYGITRPVNTRSLRDIQFGDFGALLRDIKSAPGLGLKLRYLLKPPGWSHTGNHQTTSARRLQAARTTLAEPLEFSRLEQ